MILQSHSQTAYEVVIGVEVHAQLRTQSKMFCGCGTTFGLSANSQTCPVCLGLPGSLPVINKAAVEMAVRARSCLELQDRRAQPVCAETLLLSRSPEELSNFPIRVSYLRRWLD